jgi:hypothetical protein
MAANVFILAEYDPKIRTWTPYASVPEAIDSACSTSDFRACSVSHTSLQRWQDRNLSCFLCPPHVSC